MKGSITDTTLTWHILRRQEGKLVPCLLTLERGTGVVLSEICQPANTSPVGGVAGVMQAVDRMGIPATVKLEQGQPSVHILAGNIPPATQLELEFFQLDVPCRFPGCEAFREQYQKEVAALPPDCPACEMGKIMRRYMQIIAPFLHVPAQHSGTESPS